MSQRAWLVDLDGTLYHSWPVKLLMGFELLCSGWGVLPALFFFRKEHERQREVSQASAQSAFTRQLAETARRAKLDPGQLEILVDDWMVQRPARYLRLFARRGLLAEIARFRASGGKTALVSDYPAQAKLRALGALNLFDVVVANGEEMTLSRLKPWPDGYLLAAERLGIAAAECLVIGDREDADGLAANRAGMAFRQV
jgi:HAD superfamily hydrolase (TIGR01549 family)